MAPIPLAGLVSIVARKEILPQRLQERCIPKRIAQELKCAAQPDIMLATGCGFRGKFSAAAMMV